MRRSGFSLLELLIVTALIPVLSMAVFANFNSGVKLWQAIQANLAEEDVLIFYQKAGEDFTNAIRWGEIDVDGSGSSFTFVTRIDAPAALGGGNGIGVVRYFFDPSARAIEKETKNFNQIFKKQPGTGRVALSNVDGCRFEYLFENTDFQKFEWIQEWRRPRELPLAVRATFHVAGPNGAFELVKTFHVPAGGAS